MAHEICPPFIVSSSLGCAAQTTDARSGPGPAASSAAAGRAGSAGGPKCLIPTNQLGPDSTMSVQGPETPSGEGEVVFSGLLLQVETIRAQLGIDAKGAVAILSEANSLIGLPSEGTMPQQAAALLQALGRPPSPSEHLEPEMVSQRVSRARSINASKKSLMMGLEAGGVTRPRPQHFSKDAGTNAVRVAYEGQALHAALRSLREQLQTREASPSYLVSLKLVVN